MSRIRGNFAKTPDGSHTTNLKVHIQEQTTDIQIHSPTRLIQAEMNLPFQTRDYVRQYKSAKL